MDLPTGVWVAIGAVLAFSIWNYRRHYKRKKSLRQEENGNWVWTEFDGTEHRSNIHPFSKGGAWYKDSSADGGGWSDSGGDGGGGGGE